MRLVDTEEAARTLKTTDRTIRRWFAAGKIKGEFISAQRAGNGGQKLMVYIDDEASSQTAPASTREVSRPSWDLITELKKDNIVVEIRIRIEEAKHDSGK